MKESAFSDNFNGFLGTYSDHPSMPEIFERPPYKYFLLLSFLYKIILLNLYTPGMLLLFQEQKYLPDDNDTMKCIPLFIMSVGRIYDMCLINAVILF